MYKEEPVHLAEKYQVLLLFYNPLNIMFLLYL